MPCNYIEDPHTQTPGGTLFFFFFFFRGESNRLPISRSSDRRDSRALTWLVEVSSLVLAPGLPWTPVNCMLRPSDESLLYYDYCNRLSIMYIYIYIITYVFIIIIIIIISSSSQQPQNTWRTHVCCISCVFLSTCFCIVWLVLSFLSTCAVCFVSFILFLSCVFLFEFLAFQRRENMVGVNMVLA